MCTELILASGSPRRRELLDQLGLSFEIQQSEIDETLPPHISPTQAVESLALRKATAVAEQQSHAVLVIGADTLVYQHEIIGKPADEQQAAMMLQQLQGKKHQVYSGIALVEHMPGQAPRTWVSSKQTNVWMRSLTPAQIDRYISTKEPLDKAGAYGIQGYGACLIDKIEGDYFNVVGMSLSLLDEMMTTAGYSLFADFAK